MSWYLFNNSPERELRGKKVDTYQSNLSINLRYEQTQSHP